MRNIKITRPMRGRTDTQAQLDENNLPVEESRNSTPLNITRAAKPKPPTSEMTPREALQGMPEIMGGPVSTQGFDVDLKNVDLPSYADSNMNHCGIVYQSTNWIYTGGNKAHDCEYIVDGKKMHPKSITERLGITAIAKWAKENNIERIKPKIKYRYFFINADKNTKKDMIKKLRYPIIKDYPKCDKRMYDDGDNILMNYQDANIQKLLF